MALARAEERRSQKAGLAAPRASASSSSFKPKASSRYLRVFSYEDHIDCFAPPFREAPAHWPEGYEVSKLNRTAWLPPGWGQAYKEGSERKFYVAPPELGSKVMLNKLNVDLTVGKKLKPMDERGNPLGDQHIKKWPGWLPKDWCIAYFRSAGGEPRPCFLSPSGTAYKDKKAVLAQKAHDRSGKGETPTVTVMRRRKRPKKNKKEGPIFRSFSPEELLECWRPPLGDSLTPPKHWPEGLKVSRLHRISWLPPGWTQAYREGSRRKLYVSPEKFGSKVVFHRENVEVLEGRRLLPMDQHGVSLGSDCVTQWPAWLPKDWRVGYYKIGSTVKVCFLPPGDERRFKDKAEVLGHLNGQKKPQKPKVILGPFAQRQARRIRARDLKLRNAAPFSPEKDEPELPATCDIFRSFTHEEFHECFAPPLGDQRDPPAHWPPGLEVCPLPRISWLPPGWGQGIRIGQKGRRHKVFVAPAGHGRLVAISKQSMEVILQTRLRPLDQHGKLLGLGDECLDRWPVWLPQDWRIAYFKEDGQVKICFVSPNDVRCLDKFQVLQELAQGRCVVKAKEAEDERMQQRKRLKRADVALDLEQEEVAQVEDPERGQASQPPRRRLRLLGKPCGLDASQLSEEDRSWLQKHPLYIKIHERGYPIPIGDQDILALKRFTPKEMGGDADMSFY